MKFCSICDNMLYINIDPDKNLVYYCKTCNQKDVFTKDGGSLCIIDDNKINDHLKYSQFINKYLKYDPTLPRVNNMICPNTSCKKQTEQPNEVIYIKYDPTDLKFVYYCCYCEHYWVLPS